MITKDELLELVKRNSEKISQTLNLQALDYIEIDGLGDIGALGIGIDGNGNEMEIGYAFSTQNNLGEADDNGEMMVEGNKAYWIGYNI
jgi:hypothetical protein